jgi:hypothetical protein
MHTLDANEITIVAKDPDAKMRRAAGLCPSGYTAEKNNETSLPWKGP